MPGNALNSGPPRVPTLAAARTNRPGKKPPEFPAAFLKDNDDADRRNRQALQPLGIRPAIAAEPSALETLAPAFAAAVPAAGGQRGKPPLLAVIERLVERIGRIGDFLHRSRRGHHVFGAPAQTRNRIGLRLIVGLGGSRPPPRRPVAPD